MSRWSLVIFEEVDGSLIEVSISTYESEDFLEAVRWYEIAEVIGLPFTLYNFEVKTNTQLIG